MRPFAALLPILLLLTACAGGSPAPEAEPAPADIRGIYSLSTMIQGSPVDGRMRITGEPGSYTGSVYTDFTGELPITEADVDGSHGRFTLNTPDGAAVLRLVFEDGSFSGDWSLGSESGRITGRKIR